MQESRLTEIIPLICTSAVWGQHPDTSWVSSGLTTGRGCSLMAVRWQVFFSALSFLGSLTLEGCDPWWLWHPLFIDIAGNISFLTAVTEIQPFFSWIDAPQIDSILWLIFRVLNKLILAFLPFFLLLLWRNRFFRGPYSVIPKVHPSITCFLDLVMKICLSFI